MTLSVPTVAVSRLLSDGFATPKPQTDFLSPGHYYSVFSFSSVQADRHGWRRMLTFH